MYTQAYLERLPSAEREQLLGLLGYGSNNLPAVENESTLKTATESVEETKKTSALQAKVNKLSAHLQQLMQENLVLKAKVKTLENSQVELSQRNIMLAQTIDNLRGLAGSLLKDAQLEKNKDKKTMKILQQLELQSTLVESEPPSDYPVPEPINDRNVVILRTEIERLHTDLKVKSQESATLYQRLQALEEKYQEQEKTRRVAEKAYQTKITQLNNQLIGAVRRINYLVEEKKKNYKDEKKRAGYVAKLELEYAKSKENMKSLAKKVYSLSQTDKKQEETETKVRDEVRVTEWNLSEKADSLSKDSIRILKERNIASIKSVEQEISEAQKEIEENGADIEDQIKQYYADMGQ